MGYPNVFHLVSAIYKKTGVSCVLIGGFAVNYYKVARHTADVDFLITKDDFAKISELLKKAGYRPYAIEEVFARFATKGPYLMDLDFMFIDKDTLDKIVKKGRKISIAEQEFMIPSLDHLIALKLHSIKYNPKIRENKDLPDIISLIRINKVSYKSSEFRQLCDKYGTKEIYDKILDRV